MIKETKFLGLGGCGSKLVNELKEINDLVNIGFINSNSNEMKILSNYNPTIGLFIDGNGTGRSRKRAIESMENDQFKIWNFINEDVGKYSTYVLIMALDGGFGSGSFPKVSKLIKNLNKQCNTYVDVNLVCVVPKNNSRKININNTLMAYADIKNLAKEGIINSYQFIDNNKMIKESEFNNKVMDLINKSYSINNGELDLNDSKLINSEKGYKMILELDNSFSGKLGDAINYAINETCFLVPKNYGRCRKFGCSFIESDFDKNEVLDKFTITEFDKEDYNEEMNIIVMGGMENPDSYFQRLEELYNKNEDEIEHDGDEWIPSIKAYEQSKKENFIISENIENNKSKKKLTKKDLRNMMDDLW